MASTSPLDADVFALARDGDEACVQVFFVRGTQVADTDSFMLDGTADESDAEVMSAFLAQFYEGAVYVPRTVLLSVNPSDREDLETMLRERRGRAVELRVPERGELRGLVSAAEENAREALKQHRTRWLADRDKTHAALTMLQDELDLPTLPARIECYDISTIQGTSTVASMVVFHDGAPATSEYRRFRIKTVEGQDDFASMREVLTRRFKRVAERRRAELQHGAAVDVALEETPPTQPLPEPQDIEDVIAGVETPSEVEAVEPDAPSPWDHVPDLVIIDGGKGQLSAALDVMRDLGLRDVPVCGLAKREEEIFVAGHGRAHHPAAHLGGALPRAARARRGAPLRDHLPPQGPRQGRDEVGPRLDSGRRAQAEARAHPQVRLGTRHPRRQRRGGGGDGRLHARARGDGEALALTSFRREAAAMRRREPDAEEMLRVVARQVRDPRVLEAMRAVPRDRFVPFELRREAYDDSALPIGHRQTISQPLIVGMMTEALGLTGSERVLEIGTGSGYQAAVLARLAARGRDRRGSRRAARAGRGGPRGPRDHERPLLPAPEGILGAPEHGPYDAIVVTAAAPSVPDLLVQQLREGGQLVIPVGSREAQELLALTRRGDRLERRSLGPCRFVPLVGPGGFATP